MPFMPPVQPGILYFLVILMLLGSMTATYGGDAGTVTTNRRRWVSHHGCSKPVASDNVIWPRTLYVSAETNVRCGGTEALFATNTTRSIGSYPSSSARPSVGPPTLIVWVICGGLRFRSTACNWLLPSPTNMMLSSVTSTPLGPGPFVTPGAPVGPTNPVTRATN